MVNELTVSLLAGLITGVQVRGPDGVARGLKLGDLGGALDGVNEAALLSVDALKQEIKDRDAVYESLKAAHEALKVTATKAAQLVVAIVDDQSINAEQTAVKCKEVAMHVLTPVRERELAAAVKAAQAAVDLVDRLRNG